VLLPIDMPRSLNAFLYFVGDTAAPSALFSMGVILSKTKLSERITVSGCVVLLKLFFHPVIVWLILCVIFGFTQTQALTSVLVAAAPCGTMALVIASNYQVRTDAIAPAIFFTSLGSLVSLTIVASW